MKRPFARCHLVRACIEAESVATVLQADAKLRLHTTRAKTHVIALDKAHHHAVFISRAQVNGAALDRVTCAEVLRFFHVDEFCTRCQVSRIEHLRGSHLHTRRLGHVFVSVCKGQLHGFNLQMLRVHTIDWQTGKVKLPQNAQRNQRRNALPIGRNLVQGVATVVLANRLDPLGPVVFKIFGSDAATVAV